MLLTSITGVSSLNTGVSADASEIVGNAPPPRVTFKLLTEGAFQSRLHPKDSNEQKIPTVSAISPRDEIFRVTSMVGDLTKFFLANTFEDHRRSLSSQLIEQEVEEKNSICGQILLILCLLAKSCDLEIAQCCVGKVALNGRKYPTDLCKGKANSYTAYSAETGISKNKGQSILPAVDSSGERSDCTPSDELSVEELTLVVRKFVDDRNWEQFHTPRNILLALIGELGELAELFQWVGDKEYVQDYNFDCEKKDKIGQEIADVTIYLMRLCDLCEIDLGRAAMYVLEK